VGIRQNTTAIAVEKKSS